MEHHEVELPNGREQIEELTPWAVVARYESSLDVVLDRGAARRQMEVVRDWSRELLEVD